MNNFSHLDGEGRARMVDVSGKPVTRRVAKASCKVLLDASTVSRPLPRCPRAMPWPWPGWRASRRRNGVDELIPLAHTLGLDQVNVEIEPTEGGVSVRSEVVCTARTGAEIEAMLACSNAALALYDMVKAVEKGAVITDLRLEAKSGGRSGDWRREDS